MGKDKHVSFVDLLPLANSGSEIVANEVPEFSAEDYLQRIESLFEACKGEYEYIVIYGDREHYTNTEYFTGYDPRFEESLLILCSGKNPVLVVGNEGIGYVEKVPFPVEKVLYPFFSLPKQPMDKMRGLKDIFLDAGIKYGTRVGVLGWKYFEPTLFSREKSFDLPYFIMSDLIEVAGIDSIYNANALMLDNEHGLLHNLDAKEMVLAEIAGFKVANSVYNVLKNLKDGISETEASSYLSIDGEPCSMHPNINFGDNVFYGLASPTYSKKLCHGELVSAGMGLRRALVHKVGLFIENFGELEESYSQSAQSYYETYFKAVALWYESVGIGVSGGEVYKKIDDLLGGLSNFGVGLNPGHSIHTAEWTSSPFYPGSEEKLHSGMMLQCDFTASDVGKNLSVHAEDGVLIADKELQAELEKISPSSMKRMKNRQTYMREVLGINIADEVLPTSDLCGIVFPCMKNLSVGYGFK